MYMNRLLITCLLACLLPTTAFASDFSIRPFLIDEVLEPRGEVTNQVVLSNDHDVRKYVVFATVNEISVDTEGEIKEFISPVMTDRTNTVTSWIEVTRGRIEIPPGEQREVPVTINVHPNAQPGEYHAFVGFIPAKNRPLAEEIARAGDADGVVLKVTIADKRVDSMRIRKFLLDRFVTAPEDRQVAIEIENLGDIESAPQGELIFYDSLGVELTSVSLNENGTRIPPGSTGTITAAIPEEVDSLGRFKTNVALRYGENQTASLFDTSFFYIIPWPTMLALFGGIILFSLLLTLWFKRSFVDDDFDEDGDEVTMFVQDGHERDPQDHDIDLRGSK